MPNTKPRIVRDEPLGDTLTRVKRSIAILINQYWKSLNKPIELSVLNRQFYRVRRHTGRDLTELVSELQDDGLVQIVMLTNMKRILFPKSAWDALGTDGQHIAVRRLELEFKTLRSSKPFELNDPHTNPNDEPFFTNLNRPNPNDEPA